MLFDLRSRGRRRAVVVIYLGLAILIGGGLILFGVGTGTGGGGLLNGLTGNGSSSGQSNAVDQATKAALKLTRLNPSSASAWSQLEQAYWEAAHQSSDYDSSTGAYSTDGTKQLANATDAWQRYVSLTKAPSADAAFLAAEAYAAQSRYSEEASAWQYVIASDPRAAKGYECLAFSAYAAKDTRVGNIAAQKAIKLAPKLDRLQLEQDLKASKTESGYAQAC